MALPWLATELVGGLFPAPLPGQAAPPRSAPPPQVDAWLLWWHYLALLGFVLVGLLVLYLLARWRKQSGADRLSASDQLSEFRTLYEQGQLSREEFERLRTLLGERMRREMEGPAPAEPERRPSPEGPRPQPDAPGPG